MEYSKIQEWFGLTIEHERCCGSCNTRFEVPPTSDLTLFLPAYESGSTSLEVNNILVNSFYGQFFFSFFFMKIIALYFCVILELVWGVPETQN